MVTKMNTEEEEFLKELKEDFRLESEEHIRALTTGLIELEKTPKTEKSALLIETIFREAHSLKGAARSVNMQDVESICQVLESIFGKLKNELCFLTAEQFDLIHNALDDVSKIVSGAGTKIPGNHDKLLIELQSIFEEERGGKNVEENIISDKKKTKQTSNNESQSSNDSASAELIEEKLSQIETVRIPTVKLDPLFFQAEQMTQSKITFSQRTLDLNNIYDYIDSWRAEWKEWNSQLATKSEILSKEMNNWTNQKLKELENKIMDVTHALENDQRLLGRMIDDHLESMKSLLMLPISIIVDGLPKYVRDLARFQRKEIELIIKGKEIEVDKRILEELKDPLIHLIRNCVDHGLKKPDERIRLNKKPQGTVTLSFDVTENRHLELTISDDGAGIDIDKVRSAALKAGVITKDSLEKLNDQETMMLIFKSGVSTSQIITDISGRGLGLAIVLEKVEKLGGSISIESKPNIGTTFRLELPLTMSTFRGVLVRTGEHLFAIPTVNIERAVRVIKEEIKTVENKDTIMIDGKIINTVNLGNVLGIGNGGNIKSNEKNDPATHYNYFQLLILVHADKRIAFVVDEILDEYQILVKGLGKQLSRVRNIGGAAVLGTGKVVPVINVLDLMKSAMRGDASLNKLKEVETEAVKKYKILVADDSITSRNLIKNIVGTAGFLVETAVDGVDAFTKILVGEYDLIVSDIDMPRMNGFELTEKIRKEKKISELPVVLVTALESREDKEHGIDVGANAYIIKSSFDQSNLLEVIKKLI